MHEYSSEYFCSKLAIYLYLLKALIPTFLIKHQIALKKTYLIKEKRRPALNFCINYFRNRKIFNSKFRMIIQGVLIKTKPSKIQWIINMLFCRMRRMFCCGLTIMCFSAICYTTQAQRRCNVLKEIFNNIFMFKIVIKKEHKAFISLLLVQ